MVFGRLSMFCFFLPDTADLNFAYILKLGMKTNLHKVTLPTLTLSHTSIHLQVLWSQ